MFLDDGCGKGESLQIAKGHSLFVQTSLSNAGFMAKFLQIAMGTYPVTCVLGLNWDLVSGTISITDTAYFEFHCTYRQISSIGSVCHGSGLCLYCR